MSEELITIDAIPSTITGFIELRDRVASSPQGGAAIMVTALLAFAKDRELGRQCLTVAVDRSRLTEGEQGYKGWQLQNRDLQLIGGQIDKQPYLPHAYVRGTDPANRYALPEGALTVELTTNPYSGEAESGVFKVFVACSGASSPRPVTLRRNEKGIWKTTEWSSLVVGIVGPAPEADEL